MILRFQFRAGVQEETDVFGRCLSCPVPAVISGPRGLWDSSKPYLTALKTV